MAVFVVVAGNFLSVVEQYTYYIARKYGILSNSSGHINNFCQIMYVLPKKNRVFRKNTKNIFFKITTQGTF